MTDIGSMPLDEAIQHFGVKGMRWGVKTKSPDWDREGPDPNRNVKRIATAAAVVGVVATGVALKKYGGVSVAAAAKNVAEEVLEGTVEDGPGMARKASKAAKAAGDIIDGEVVKNGASAVRALGPRVWNTPVAAIAS